LPDCLASLQKQTLNPEEIIVVDNASSDQSADYVRNNFPQVKVIENKKNLGFTGANNQGIKEALKSNPDYIFLLNQDTIMGRSCLAKMAAIAGEQEQQDVFAWQPLICCWPEQDKVQTSGDQIHFLGFGYSGDYRREIDDFYRKEGREVKEIPYASGAAMFINARLLSEVGLLDNDLFLYHEDLDLCWRARLLGYKIRLIPQARIYHKYTAGISAHRWYWSERGRLIVLLKSYRLLTLLILSPLFLIMELGCLGWSLVNGYLRLKVKSYFSALGQLPRTLRKRIKIQRQRKLSDREMSVYLTGVFSLADLDNPLLRYAVNPVFSLIWRGLKKIIFW